MAALGDSAPTIPSLITIAEATSESWSSSTATSPPSTVPSLSSGSSSTEDSVFGGWQESHSTFVGDLVLITQYLWSTSRREWKTWATGVFTVALVVFFVALLQNNIERSPIIFWRLSELSVGEIDMNLAPKPNPAVDSGQTSPLLNYTALNERIRSSCDLASFVVPRWYGLGKVSNRDVSTRVSSSIVMLYDSVYERSVRMGRAWRHRPLGELECHISAPTLRALGVSANAGQRVVLSFDSQTIESLLGTNAITEFLNSFFPTVGTGGINIGGGPNTTVIDPVAALQGLFPIFEAAGLNTTALTPEVLAGIFGGNATIPALLTLAVDPNAFLNALFPSGLIAVTYTNGSVSNVALRLELTVVDAVDKPSGKYPEALGNVVLLDVRALEVYLKAQITAFIANPLLAILAPATVQALQPVAAGLATFTLNDYALTVIVNYRDRDAGYLLTGDALRGHMTRFSDNVLAAVGFNATMEVTLPVYTTLSGTEIIRLFLDQIFNAVVFVLTMLSALLIYSLMLSNVEEKTYEYGMLRALGMRQRSLMVLLVLQALSFAIPGISIGWLAALLIDIPISQAIATFADLAPAYGLAWWPLVLSLLLGLVMPMVANYVPIRRAMSKNLRTALDVYHQATSETRVTMQRLESLGLSAWQTALAIILVVVGFVTYYLIPYAFIFGNLALFLTILTAILLGIVLGLAMIAQVIQPYGEWLMLLLIVQGEDRRLKPLIRKNLSGHRSRNRKTALMFTVSLAFLIFAGALFSLQQRLLTDLISSFLGADVVATSLDWKVTLDEAALRGYLDSQSGELVRSFSFTTPPIEGSDIVTIGTTSTIVNFPKISQSVIGIDQNYLTTAYVKYVAITQYDPDLSYMKTSNGKLDVADSLYRDAGKARLSIESGGAAVVPPILVSGPRFGTGPDVATEVSKAYLSYIDCIVSQALHDSASISIDTPLALTFKYKVSEARTLELLSLAKVRAMVSKFPGFFFSSYRQFARFTPVLTRFDSYGTALARAYNVTTIVSELPQPQPVGYAPKGSLLVRMGRPQSRLARETLINGMRNFISNDQIQVIDVVGLIATTSVAIEMIQLFFIVVAVLTSILSFFVLLLSFTANIRENAWEFGVLRAVGLSGAQSFRVYLYEAFALIGAAVTMGTVVGLLVAVALTLQMGLFTESPFQFVFPYALFFACLVLSILVTVVGSWLPARSMMKKEIAAAMKG